MNAVAAALASILLMAVASNATAEVPLPASAFARLPAMSMVRLSPDGNRVAWAGFEGDKSFVTMFELATGKSLRRLQTDTGQTLRSLHWADDETLLIEVSMTMNVPNYSPNRRTYEFFRYIAADAAGGPLRVLLLNDAVTGATLVQTRTGRSGKVVMASFDFLATAYRGRTRSRLNVGDTFDGWVYSLFDVDTRTGEKDRIEGGTEYTMTWLVDQAGKPLARGEWDSEKREFSIQAKVNGSWKTIYSGSDPDDLYPMGRSADGRSIVAVGARGGNRELAWLVPLDGGEISLLAETDENVEYTIRNQFTGSVAGLQLGGLHPRIHWLDPRLDRVQQSISKAFPEKIVGIHDRTEDYSRVLASVEDGSSPPVYYLVNFSKGTADTIGESYPELTGARLGTEEATSYQARDGIEIPAYLTLPPGGDPKNLPLVVFPHGGPESRDEAGFDWWVQFLATRGYAVLRPQFRGSIGFGADLKRAGERAWGQAMQDDLSDGVAALAKRGIVDPARVCIIGASYGGYAALAGAAFTPELYACAASINGITDLPSMYGYLQNRYGNESDALAAWQADVGHPYDANLAQNSPLRSVASIRAPILLIHGTDDIIVPFIQSERFAKTLAVHGKQHELISLKGEDHWLSSGSSRLQVLQTLETFLAKHLAPSP